MRTSLSRMAATASRTLATLKEKHSRPVAHFSGQQPHQAIQIHVVQLIKKSPDASPRASLIYDE